MVDIKVPTLGESISTATIAKWFKKEGESVAMDEAIVELETDKVTVEVNAPAAGAIEKILAKEGDEVEVGAILGSIKEGAAGATTKKEEAKQEAAPAAANNANKVMPAAAKQAADRGVDTATISGTGKDGRVTKGDVINAPAQAAATTSSPQPAANLEERVKMTKLRQTIAKRLKESQNTAAILTTFNEVDMSEVMKLRKKYQDKFVEKYGVKLGFMSLFTKAAVNALQEIPSVNASIEGDEIIYKKYYNIGVAVGTKQGLVVPVLRNCENKNYADIEKEIAELGKKARDGKLGMSELTGGSFSITNGGIFGSMLSTPIINPPQTAILGMHNIVERPVAVNGEVKIRPIMYIALSYDHRLIDGGEAVTFLVKIKEAIENPERLLIGV
ncbi:MAG: dihydrolipoyllysine-residue succinyltransferase [Alphaproteobacteria bacterium CG11_big_fil_rev_8_21_14_0_20_44_7]|nr:MAG: dihydrolipoyllysine-residue succinyltransferase [Alphaproteobacteria bacterium CG11_big_fil_rev_8_21_14_0_20_44_7]